jgi:hypothetical protein
MPPASGTVQSPPAASIARLSTGLTVPDDLNVVPRSIFADPSSPTLDKFYDQIARIITRCGWSLYFDMQNETLIIL